MTFTAIGDLAQSLQLRRENARLSADLQRLTTELATGRKADLRTSLSGDFGSLAAFEATITRLDAFNTAAAEARQRADTVQLSLGLVAEEAGRAANSLLLSETGGQPALVDIAAGDAARVFDTAISALNVQFAGETLFGGRSTDGPALADTETILAALETAATGAGVATAADLEAVVDAWFAPGGDFDTVAYLGTTDPRAPARIGPNSEAAAPPLASDPALRDTLAGLALATLVDRGALPGLFEERAAATQRAGEKLIQSGDALTDLRAAVGVSQERIALAETTNAAERAAADLARNELIAADPFEAATALEATRVQIETLFSITARLSRLSLSEFLR